MAAERIPSLSAPLRCGNHLGRRIGFRGLRRPAGLSCPPCPPTCCGTYLSFPEVGNAQAEETSLREAVQSHKSLGTWAGMTPRKGWDLEFYGRTLGLGSLLFPEQIATCDIVEED